MSAKLNSFANLQALDSLQLRHTLYEVFRPQ